MNRDVWIGERAKLQSILNDIDCGLIRLAKGQDEYLVMLKARIQHLDDKIAADPQMPLDINASRAEPLALRP
jgi:hypothetical protein